MRGWSRRGSPRFVHTATSSSERGRRGVPQCNPLDFHGHPPSLYDLASFISPQLVSTPEKASDGATRAACPCPIVESVAPSIDVNAPTSATPQGLMLAVDSDTATLIYMIRSSIGKVQLTESSCDKEGWRSSGAFNMDFRHGFELTIAVVEDPPKRVARNTSARFLHPPRPPMPAMPDGTDVVLVHVGFL